MIFSKCVSLATRYKLKLSNISLNVRFRVSQQRTPTILKEVCKLLSIFREVKIHPEVVSKVCAFL